MNVHKTLSRGFGSSGRIAALLAVCMCAWLGRAQLSQAGVYASPGPLYKVKTLPDVRVRMRDGVELSALIIRPASDGKFPAIMSYYPYRVLPDAAKAVHSEKYSPGPNTDYYMAQHGYVIVYYDVRGTGASGGVSTEMYEDAERQDGYDMVEWIARQPWSNGNVGMWGISYGGVDSLQIAAMAPPHLKAIIVHAGTDDVYNDWMYPGGSYRSMFMAFYGAEMTAFNFAPPDPASTGEKWEDLWQQHLKGNRPWTLGWLQHQVYGPYWKVRSVRPDYGRIKCAVFVIDGWADWYQTALLRTFSHLKVPKRALIGPWDHSWSEDALPGPRIDGRPLYLQWFDQFLKGIHTGVLKEPPVTIFVQKYQPPAPMYLQERGFFRQENEWPLSRTRYTPMYLTGNGVLAPDREEDVPMQKDSYRYKPSLDMASGIVGRGTIGPWAMPLDQRGDEAYSLTYTSKALPSDMEVTGDPQADIYISSTANVAYFTVRVTDVAPDGTSKLVSRGQLDATHRDSNSNPQPITPESVYELKIPMKSMAYIFPAGHRVRVDIASADIMNAWPVGKAAINSLVRGARYPSRVILPVAPPQSPALPLPDFRPSPVRLPDPDTIPKPTYTMTYDLINQTATATIVTPGEHTTFTVSDKDPADAVMKSVVNYAVTQPDGVITVQTQSIVTSDDKVFRHMLDLQTTVDGKPYFSKSWTLVVPRTLN